MADKSIRCTDCGHMFTVAKETVGGTIACPKCTALVKVKKPWITINSGQVIGAIGILLFVGFSVWTNIRDTRQRALGLPVQMDKVRKSDGSPVGVEDFPAEFRGPIAPLSKDKAAEIQGGIRRNLSGIDRTTLVLLTRKMMDALPEHERRRFLQLHAKGMTDITQAELEERIRLQNKAMASLSEEDRQLFVVTGLKSLGVDVDEENSAQAAEQMMEDSFGGESDDMRALTVKGVYLLPPEDRDRVLELHALFRGERSRQITPEEWQEMSALNRKALLLLPPDDQERMFRATAKASGFSVDQVRASFQEHQ